MFNHYSTFSSKKSCIIERVIRIIKNWLYYKEFSFRANNYKWIDIIHDITYKYNHPRHRTISMRPSDVDVSTKIELWCKENKSKTRV